MHIAIQKIKTAPSDTPNKNGTQQKRYSLMLFENNGTLQRWHMKKNPPEIDKYDTHEKWCLTKMVYITKMAYITKNAQRLFAMG